MTHFLEEKDFILIKDNLLTELSTAILNNEPKDVIERLDKKIKEVEMLSFIYKFTITEGEIRKIIENISKGRTKHKEFKKELTEYYRTNKRIQLKLIITYFEKAFNSGKEGMPKEELSLLSKYRKIIDFRDWYVHGRASVNKNGNFDLVINTNIIHSVLKLFKKKLSKSKFVPFKSANDT
jgi:replicative superfamily II helicase